MNLKPVLIFLAQIAFISSQVGEESKKPQDDQICDIEDMEDAMSALSRAKTQHCKEEIIKLACKLNIQKKLNILSNEKLDSQDEPIQFFKVHTNRKCAADFSLKGCVSLTYVNLLINKLETLRTEQNDSSESHDSTKQAKIVMSDHLKDVVSTSRCQSVCLSLNQFRYAAYNKQTRECYCFKNLTDRFDVEKKCDASVNSFAVYSTGILDINAVKEEYVVRSQKEIQETFEAKKKSLPRIVFLLTLNGRSIRQIFRLIKTIYNEIHFYYIHIDERMKFLRHEISNFIKESNKKNIFMPEWSEATMWGGTSLLQMHLRVFRDLLEMRNKWNWDFIINLSETDFPIKSIQDLTLYLDKFRGKTFLRFHNGPYEKFSFNQAIELAFLQCENHMWKVGKRQVPLGLQFAGGSDWFCLNHEFVDYVINSNDEYLNNLKTFYEYSLLPSESFFHTVYVNSPFCHEEIVNNHLKFINWKRKRGCNCQYKSIVDWCGCSPNFITMDTLSALKEFEKKPAFFARKFDPLSNHQLINIVDQSIFGLYSASFKSLNSYWQNVYHSIDGEKSLSNAHRILFDEFLKKLSLEFIDRLNSLKTHLASSSYTFDSLEFMLGSELNLKSIRRVEAYFEANRFRGYVLNIQTSNHRNNISFEIEAYFTPKSSKELMSTHFNVSNEISMTVKNYILQILTRFLVSSEFDIKEREFTNYASVIDQKSDLALLMEFDPIEKDIDFWITWVNSLNETVKEVKVNLARNEKGQILVNKLFTADQEKFLNTSGTWKVYLSVKPDKIVSRNFLVLPYENDSSQNEQQQKLANNQQTISNFWSLRQLCTHSLPSINFKGGTFLFNELFKQCTMTYWSTYFPDPKSDVQNSCLLGPDLENRIIV